MKVNEIIEEGVVSGLKRAGGGVADIFRGKVGQGLGNLAGGAVDTLAGLGTNLILRPLDKLAGGSGKVGTKRQQAERIAANARREAKSQRKNLPEIGRAHV